MQAWLDERKHHFKNIWASFVNWSIRVANRAKDPRTSNRRADEDHLLAVLGRFPASATDVIGLLEMFEERYWNPTRAVEGEIKFVDGRKYPHHSVKNDHRSKTDADRILIGASDAAINAAQSVLYDLVLSPAQQRANAPAQAAVRSVVKDARRKRKLERRAARRGEQSTSSDAQDEDVKERPAEAGTMQLPLRPAAEIEGPSEQGLSRFTLAMRPFQ